MKEQYANGDISLRRVNDKRKRKVFCLETEEYFDSLCEASDKYSEYGVNIYNLSKRLNRPDERKSCGHIYNTKLHWRFFEVNENGGDA